MAYKFNPLLGVGLEEVGAGGGAAAPGGADTQVQFNDGGAFAGDSGLVYDDTAGALTVGGKTVTTDAPIINLSQTWNNAATTFTGLKLNVTDTASAADSNLLDLQTNGTSLVTVTPTGKITIPRGSGVDTGLQIGSSINLDTNGPNTLTLRVNNSRILQATAAGLYANSYILGADGGGPTISRDPANVLKVADASGVGYLKLIPTTVGALTAAATVGAGTKAFVTDSTNTLASHHGDVVAGGGSNFTPVYSDGTDWRIG
jgi:hypothetical protein